MEQFHAPAARPDALHVLTGGAVGDPDQQNEGRWNRPDAEVFDRRGVPAHDAGSGEGMAEENRARVCRMGGQARELRCHRHEQLRRTTTAGGEFMASERRRDRADSAGFRHESADESLFPADSHDRSRPDQYAPECEAHRRRDAYGRDQPEEQEPDL